MAHDEVGEIQSGPPKDIFSQTVVELVKIIDNIAETMFKHDQGNEFASALATSFAKLLSMVPDEVAKKKLYNLVWETQAKIVAGNNDDQGSKG